MDAALYTDKILKQSIREQMWTPVELNNGAPYPYGFGWELAPAGSHKAVSHGGSPPDFRAALARFVEEQVTVIVLANSDRANSSSLAVGVAALYLPGPIPRVDTCVLVGYVGP